MSSHSTVPTIGDHAEGVGDPVRPVGLGVIKFILGRLQGYDIAAELALAVLLPILHKPSATL